MLVGFVLAMATNPSSLFFFLPSFPLVASIGESKLTARHPSIMEISPQLPLLTFANKVLLKHKFTHLYDMILLRSANVVLLTLC